MSTHKPIPVRDKKIKLKKRKKFPYLDIISLLLQGEDVFLEINRKLAYYLKRRLNTMFEALGYYIEAYPSIIEENGKELVGYVFRLAKWRGGNKVYVDKDMILDKLHDLIKKTEAQLKVLDEQPPDRSLTNVKKQLIARLETLKEVLRLIEEL